VKQQKRRKAGGVAKEKHQTPQTPPPKKQKKRDGVGESKNPKRVPSKDEMPVKDVGKKRGMHPFLGNKSTGACPHQMQSKITQEGRVAKGEKGKTRTPYVPK